VLLSRLFSQDHQPYKTAILSDSAPKTLIFPNVSEGSGRRTSL
jgi:hypothetical protein